NNHEVMEIFNLSDPTIEDLIECGKNLKNGSYKRSYINGERWSNFNK
ncbi:hypothetical protein SFB1_125G0, partial [Candidatus Arthromitus sp. SFB-1]